MSRMTGEESELTTASRAIVLSNPGERTRLAKIILEEIDAYCEETYDDGPRSHLGASLIGHECQRYLWYTFRWFKHVRPHGRLARLSNRGHREEARFIEWLRGIGFEVWEVADDGNQHRIKGVRGHFGGSLDGICKPPERYALSEPMLFLNEFKTNGTGRGFQELKEKGVAVAKPQHFMQMSTYGKFYGFKYALYMNICKNDDDLYIEIVELDWNLAEDGLRRAEDIITAQFAPPRLSMQETYFKCKGCDFAGICHRGEPAVKNCRSCKWAEPIENAEWFCHNHNGVIPKDFIPKGCGQHSQIG